jgi:diguanylate cyclase (GGDEF)-like protein
MNRIAPLFLAALLSFPVSLLSAQGPQRHELSFSLLSFREGLANTSVSSIVQDSRGFLWFGTQGGLNRFDGKEFKLYENEPFVTNSLSQNLIQTLYMDADDVLWVGTYGGLNRFDPKTEAFSVFRNDPARADSLSGDLVIAITRDSAGTLWVGTSAGLNRMDGESGTFKRYANDPADPASLPDNTVRALTCDSSGRLWVGTAKGGFARYDPATDSFRRYAFAPGDPASLPVDSAGAVMSIDQAPDGGLWVGCWGLGSVKGGLSLFDPEKGSFKTWRLPDERIYVVDASLAGSVYAGTWGGGLFKLDPPSGTITSYKHSEVSGSLPHDVVYSLLRDRSGVFWVGTNGGGIAKVASANEDIRVFQANPKDPKSLPMGKVTSVHVDSEGTLWAGVYNGGLNRYDAAADSWRHYRHDSANPASLPNDIVNCFYEDSRKRLWVGTNEGLALMDKGGGTFRTYLPVKNDPDSIGSELINIILEDPKGNLWIGTISQGLDYFDLASGKFTHYRNDPDDASSLSDNLVYSLSFDAKGRLWVGTNKGLNRMEDGKFARYLYDPGNLKGISNNSIMALLRDSSGNMWMGSKGGGLIRYLPETDSFAHATTKDGLPSNAVYGVMEDPSGILWVVTQKGMVSYDPKTSVIGRVSSLKSLNDNSFTNGCTIAPNGRVYFSSVGTLFALDLRKVSRNTVPPPVYVTDIRAANERKLAGPVSGLDKPIRLRYWENSVEFRFAALDYQDPQSNQFAYKLQGFDKNWIYSGTSNSAVYTNLPGGDYVFRVKAANNDGVWNESGANIPLKVATPLWLSTWAFALYLLVVIMLGYMLSGLRSRKAMKRKIDELSSTKSALESANAKLEELSSIDALTGVANRRKMDMELATAWSFTVRAGMPISGLMIDIDFFKKFNDEYGHQAGDECLRRVAAAMTSQLERGTDIVCRYGGEEFFLFLPSTPPEGARVIGERLLNVVKGLGIPHAYSSAGNCVTVSIGLATLFPIPGDSSESLVKKADEALYRAKNAGRNRLSE